MKFTDKIENLLPLGYLFLVILGIFKESVLYYQLGINILNYSSIYDILISPISTITSHYIILICVLLLFLLCYKLPSFLMKNHHKNWVKKQFSLKKDLSNSTSEELINCFNIEAIRFLAFMLLSFFLGFGFAQGFMASKKIKDGNVKYDYNLNYNSGETEKISVIGFNSSYYFFTTKENKNIKIVPIGTIKSLEFIDNKRLK